MIGTPAFMAPESLAGDKAVDHRADLYALGCVAFFLLTGQHVFHGRTPLQALMDHVTHARRHGRRRGPTNPIPGWVDDLVLACLAKDPDDRPQSASEIGQRIVMLEGSARWTPAQAQDWWRTHLPALAGVSR